MTEAGFTPLPKNDAPLVLAHRGGCSPHPENTLAAFRFAHERGVTQIETDVRTTRDGVAIVVHDRSLRARLRGPRYSIDRITYAQLAELSDAPRLDEVLLKLPAVTFNLDLKDWGSVASVPTVINATSSSGRVRVTSFSDRRIHAAADRLPPETSLGLGVWRSFALAAAALVGWRGRLSFLAGSDVVQVPWRAVRLPVIGARFIRQAQRRGISVHVWTVNSAAEMEAALDAGVDGIVTDHPELGLAIVDRRLAHGHEGDGATSS
jgi:glycerophosphoryl diester phosphodiesterase